MKLRIFIFTLLALFLAGNAYLYSTFYGCETPITYSIGTFDERFEISKADFLATLAEAEEAWEGPQNKEYFRYEPDGKLKVNLLYDARQAETEQLKKLNTSISAEAVLFEARQREYEVKRREYLDAITEYEAAVALYDARRENYEEDVEYWNARGGAPKGEYERLRTEQTQLRAEAAGLELTRQKLNQMVGDLNTRGKELNQMARRLNIKIEAYNETGTVVREDFEQGLYISDHSGSRINIYQFENRDKLLGVLIHEMGHALDLEHNQDKSSVMYEYNLGSTQVVTKADLEALSQTCHGK